MATPLTKKEWKLRYIGHYVTTPSGRSILKNSSTKDDTDGALQAAAEVALETYGIEAEPETCSARDGNDV